MDSASKMKNLRLREDIATPWRGFSLIVIITIVVVFFFFLDVTVRATTEGKEITVLTSSALGLRAGSPVWVAGRPAGRVLSVDFGPPSHGGPTVVIRSTLKHNTGSFVRADARITVRTTDLLGPAVLAIDPGSGNKAPWDSADTLRTEEPLRDLETIIALSDSLLEGMRRLQTQAAETKRAVESGSGSLALIQQNPNLFHDMRADLEQMQETLANNLPRSLLGQLSSDTLIGPSFARIRDRLARWNDLPSRGKTQSSIKTLTEALETIASRLQQVIRNVTVGEGTAGRLLVDKELTRQVELLKAQISDLSEYLKNHPGTWLRVRAF
jgi:hypothetical protein